MIYSGRALVFTVSQCHNQEMAAIENDPDKKTVSAARRRSNRTQPLSALLGRIAGPALRRQGFVRSELISRWPMIVGDALARHSLPQRLRFSKGRRDGATLWLIADGPFALELQHLTPQLLERINRFFGYRAVAEVRVRQGRLKTAVPGRQNRLRKLTISESKALDDLLSETRHEELHQALSGLGRQILGRSVVDKSRK